MTWFKLHKWHEYHDLTWIPWSYMKTWFDMIWLAQHKMTKIKMTLKWRPYARYGHLLVLKINTLDTLWLRGRLHVYDSAYDFSANQIRIWFFISHQLQPSVYTFQQKMYQQWYCGTPLAANCMKNRTRNHTPNLTCLDVPLVR
jgi:hypothetical protein